MKKVSKTYINAEICLKKKPNIYTIMYTINLYSLIVTLFFNIELFFEPEIIVKTDAFIIPK